MQLCRIIYYSLAALHVSSDIFVHHQEHLNCITASGITHVCRCRLVSWECWNCWNNKLSYTVASCWSFSYIISWCTETWWTSNGATKNTFFRKFLQEQFRSEVIYISQIWYRSIISSTVLPAGEKRGTKNSSSRLVWFYQFTFFSLHSFHRDFLIFMSSTLSLPTSVDYSTFPFPYPLLPWLPCRNRVFESPHSYFIAVQLPI